jgi:hypothetical protein
MTGTIFAVAGGYLSALGCARRRAVMLVATALLLVMITASPALAARGDTITSASCTVGSTTTTFTLTWSGNQTPNAWTVFDPTTGYNGASSIVATKQKTKSIGTWTLNNMAYNGFPNFVLTGDSVTIQILQTGPNQQTLATTTITCA